MDSDKLQSDLDKAHQQELNDLEDKLTEKHRKELGNLEKQLTSKIEELAEAHKVMKSCDQLFDESDHLDGLASCHNEVS